MSKKVAGERETSIAATFYCTSLRLHIAVGILMFPSFQLSNFSDVMLLGSIVFVSFLFGYLSTLESLFIVCSHSFLSQMYCCSMYLYMWLCLWLWWWRSTNFAFYFSIDHELQFVYARIDFTEMCDAGRNQHQHWFSSEPCRRTGKRANRTPYRCMFQKEYIGASQHKLWNRITVLVRACLVSSYIAHTPARAPHPNHTQSCVHRRIINYV